MKITLHIASIAVLLNLCSSCKSKIESQKPVTDSVKNMMTRVAGDISTKGPIGWLDYFENSPAFYMASDGRKVLKDYPGAVAFVKDTLIKAIPHIKLQWQNVTVDSISNDFASIGADFHEDLTMGNGISAPDDGYFTAVAHFDGSKWKLRNLHWSSRMPVKNGH